MSTQLSSPRATGGSGYIYEHKIGAYFLASLLTGFPILGSEYGQTVRVDFQTAVDGDVFDDIRVITKNQSQEYLFAFQVKLNQSFSGKKAPKFFVDDAWEQYKRWSACDPTDRKKSFGLITTEIPFSTERELSQLFELVAANDPEALAERINKPRWTNEGVRSLFQSFTQASSRNGAETARMLHHLVVKNWNFDDQSSAMKTEAISLCETALANPSQEEANRLWDRLCAIVQKKAPNSGHVNLTSLIGELRGSFALAGFPDYQHDWQTIEKYSLDNANDVISTLANSVHVPRGAEVVNLESEFERYSGVVLHGPSGIGKSALVEELYRARITRGERTIWVRGKDSAIFDDLNHFEKRYSLQHSVADLFLATTGGAPLLIIDGLDHPPNVGSSRYIKQLIDLSASGGHPGSDWRVLITCQTQNIGVILNSLQNGTSKAPAWNVVNAPVLTREALLNAVTEGSNLQAVLTDYQLRAVFPNLKMLDVVSNSSKYFLSKTTFAPLSEFEIANQFWGNITEKDTAQRMLTLTNFVSNRNTWLSGSSAIDTVGAEVARVIDDLKNDDVMRVSPNGIVDFAHDLYGDWIRAMYLFNNANQIIEKLKEVQSYPLWSRAIQIYSLGLIDNDRDLKQWFAFLDNLRAHRLQSAFDNALLGPVILLCSHVSIEELIRGLLNHDRSYVGELIDAFTVFAKIPGHPVEELHVRHREIQFQAGLIGWQLIPEYWVRFIDALNDVKAELIELYPRRLAEIASRWMADSDANNADHPEIAANIAIALGNYSQTTHGRQLDNQTLTEIYSSVIYASEVFPDVAFSTLEAAAGLPDLPAPKVASTVDELHQQVKRIQKNRVPQAFEDALLFAPAFVKLQGASGFRAARLLLSCVFSPPLEEEEASTYWIANNRKSIRKDLKSLFFFWLISNFETASDVILYIVDVETERLTGGMHQQKNKPDMCFPSESTLSGTRLSSDYRGREAALLRKGGGVQSFLGGEMGFAWREPYHLLPAYVRFALEAMEFYLGTCIERGNSITTQLSSILFKAKSTPVLNSLIRVGRKYPELFAGPLLELLSIPELYLWEKKYVNREASDLYFDLEFHAKTFGEMAVDTVLKCKEEQQYFSRVRNWWSSEAFNNFPDPRVLEQLLLILNQNNWTPVRRKDGGDHFVNEQLEKLQDELAQISAAPDLKPWSPLIKELREMEVQSHSDSLEAAWREWLDTLKVVDDEDDRVDLQIVGLRAFLSHPRWLNQSQERLSVADEILAEIAEFARSSEVFKKRRYSPTQDLAVEIAVLAARAYCAANKSTVALQVVFHALLSGDGNVIKSIFRTLQTERDLLWALRKIMLEYAAIEPHISFLDKTDQSRPSTGIAAAYFEFFAHWKAESWEFLQSQINQTPDLIQAREDLQEHEFPRAPHLNFVILWASTEDIQAALDGSHRLGFSFWKSVTEMIGKLPNVSDVLQTLPGFGHQVFKEVLEKLADVILQGFPGWDVGVLWEPLIDGLDDSGVLVQLFMEAIHTNALEQKEPPLFYERLRYDIYNHLNAGYRTPALWEAHSSAWVAVGGFSSCALDKMEARHAVYFRKNQALIEKQFAQLPSDWTVVIQVARWLTLPAARHIRLNLLPGLLDTVNQIRESAHLSERNLRLPIAALLDLVVDEHPVEVAQDGVAQDVFMEFKNWLEEGTPELLVSINSKLKKMSSR